MEAITELKRPLNTQHGFQTPTFLKGDPITLKNSLETWNHLTEHFWNHTSPNFDRKLQVFKNLPKLTIFDTFVHSKRERSSLRSQCWMRLFSEIFNHYETEVHFHVFLATFSEYGGKSFLHSQTKLCIFYPIHLGNVRCICDIWPPRCRE